MHGTANEWPSVINLALQTAALTGDENQCKRLILGADVNSAGNGGWTPLHNAAKSGHASLCAYLIDNGARVDHINHKKETPLYVAAESGRASVCDLLLSHGADPDYGDRWSGTPFTIAAGKGHTSTCAVFLSHVPIPGMMRPAPGVRQFAVVTWRLVS